MLTQQDIKVYNYLRNYFKENYKPITIFDIDVDFLSLAETEKCFERLSHLGMIKLNTDYIYPSVEGIQNK